MKGVLGLLMFLGLIAASELFMHYELQDQIQEPLDIEVDRRPKNKNVGWPEYLAGPKEKDGKLCILISNSQGYSHEQKNTDLIYFSQLKDSIQAFMPDYNLANWSVPGLQTVEMELLAQQAFLREADMILFVVSLSNFEPIEDVSLDRSITDIKLIAGKPGIWPYQSRSIYGSKIEMEDRLMPFFTLNLDLIRSRDYYYEKAKKKVPLDDHLFCFGNFYAMDLIIREGEMNQVVKDLEGIDVTNKQEVSEYKKRRNKEANKQLTSSFQTFLEFDKGLNSLFQDTDTKVFYIFTPVPTPKATEFKSNFDLFITKLESFESSSDRFFKANFTYAFGDELFYSKKGETKSHFSVEGHSLYSRMLFNLVKDEL